MKKHKKKILKRRERGITLIALVITIIVLLILAGVSIAMLTGQNGILTQANNAKTANTQGTVEEMVTLAIGSLQTENLGDTSKITPSAIASKVNEENNRTDVRAEGSSFPTNIIFEDEGLKVPVDINLKVGTSEENTPLPIYSTDVDESKIAPQDLFDYEIIDGDASKIASTGTIDGLSQKEARITRIKPEYCNGGGYNPDTEKNDLTDTNYAINYSGITDTLIIPYQLEIDGEMYRVTEVSLNVIGKASDSSVMDTKVPLIKNIIFPNTIKIINMSDGNSILENVQLSENLTSIGDGAFSGCSKLSSITIPEGVTSIGDSAFSGCSSLSSITIPEGVTSIGYGAFDGCSSLSSITIPENVTSIEYNAFSGCSSLSSITIPEKVTSIGWNAFSECSSLSSITIPEKVTSIGDDAFLECTNLTEININKPEGSLDISDIGIDEEKTKVNWNG